jgi:hypothetical protein
MRRARHTWLAGALVFAACEPGYGKGARPELRQDSVVSRMPTTQPGNSLRSQWSIAPNSVGPISSRTTEADLQKKFGDNELRRARIQLGEGETTPGTVLFPGDSTRRAEIIWRDTLRYRRPSRVVFRGDRSLWQASGGISLGTTLEELEQLNGRPFTLAGFGWDYAGVIIDWQGGTLDSVLSGIKLYLDPGPAQQQSAAYSQVLGDRNYSSSLPAMEQLNPKVTQIFVDFEGP